MLKPWMLFVLILIAQLRPPDFATLGEVSNFYTGAGGEGVQNSTRPAVPRLYTYCSSCCCSPALCVPSAQHVPSPGSMSCTPFRTTVLYKNPAFLRQNSPPFGC